MEEEPFVHPDFIPPHFGTVGRAGFEEIFVGAPVSWAPATTFWLLLGLALLGLLGYAAFRAIRAYRRNAYRRAAVGEITALRARVAGGEHAAVGQLPALLKRCAMVAYGRATVAALTGDDWLTFLDAHGPRPDFVAGAGSVLPAVVFRGPAAVPSEDAGALLDLAESWIRGHRV